MNIDLKLIAKVKTQELGVIALLTNGFQIFKSNFIALFIVALITDLSIILISEVISPTYNQLIRTSFTQFRFWWIALIFRVFSLAVVSTIVEQYVLNGKIDIVSTLKQGFSKWGILVWRTSFIWVYSWELLASLISLFLADVFTQNFLPLFPLFLILGLILLTNQFFFMHAIWLRDLKGKQAILYSKSLVQGRWKRVFMTLLALLVNNYFLTYITVSISFTLMRFFSAKFFVADIIFQLIIDIVWLFWFVVITLFFLNLEYRKT